MLDGRSRVCFVGYPHCAKQLLSNYRCHNSYLLPGACNKYHPIIIQRHLPLFWFCKKKMPRTFVLGTKLKGATSLFSVMCPCVWATSPCPHGTHPSWRGKRDSPKNVTEYWLGQMIITTATLPRSGPAWCSAAALTALQIVPWPPEWFRNFLRQST